MDPASHFIIGLGISAFSGESTQLTNPVVLGSAIGAISPDIDIVVKYVKDNFSYLKHHRGPTHSIVALVVMSLLISTGLYFILPGYSFLKIFMWTFIGSLSHTFFDYLNVYGANFFYPFIRSKHKANLLMLYDPFILALAFILIFVNTYSTAFYILIVSLFVIYMIFVHVSRYIAKKILVKHYGKSNVRRLYIIPDLIHPIKKNFILKTYTHRYVGSVNFITKKIKIIKDFENIKEEYREIYERSELGKYFSHYSPEVNVFPEIKKDKILLHCMDMRFYIRKDFLHNATIICDKDGNILESYFRPYKKGNRIKVD